MGSRAGLRSLRRAAALAVFLVPALLAPGGVSGDPSPTVRVATRFEGRELRVEARVVPGLPADVTRRLASGLATTTSWRIGLYASRDVFWDGLKDERRYEVTATYRPLSGDYTIERRLDGRLLETRIAAGRDEALESLARVPALPLFVMGDHLLGKRLLVKARGAWAIGVSLGVVPATIETGAGSSPSFLWPGTAPR